MKKPIIGLIGRPDKASDDDKVICIWEGTRRAVVKKGGIPLLLLPNQDIEYEEVRPREVDRLTEEQIEELKEMVDLCDAILMPGGYKWYEYDKVIYEYALSKDMPILGICAGMQMMARIDNDNSNITAYTTLPNETKIDHHQRGIKYVHTVDIKEDTKLYQMIDQKNIKVNSKHNYHLDIVTNLKVSAYSEDGLIEAIEYPNKTFAIGVQWHPETMLEYDNHANKLFDEFIKCASNYKENKGK